MQWAGLGCNTMPAPGTIVNAATDLWHWAAIYVDGDVLEEIDGEGRHHGFAEVDQPRLAAVALLPTDQARLNGYPQVVVEVDPETGERPIFFRRRRVCVSLADGETVGGSTITYVGRQVTIGGQCVKTFLRLYDDGSLRLTTHDDDDDFDEFKVTS